MSVTDNLANDSSQALGPNNQIHQRGTAPPVTNPEPSKKGRRKLNRAIFDIDTAAALRTNAQATPKTAEAKSPPLHESAIRQGVENVNHPPDPVSKSFAESAPVERAPGVGNLKVEQPRAQSKDVSCSGCQTTSSRLISFLGRTFA